MKIDKTRKNIATPLQIIIYRTLGHTCAHSSRMFLFDVGVEVVVIVRTKVDKVVKLSAVDTVVDGRCLKP